MKPEQQNTWDDTTNAKIAGLVEKRHGDAPERGDLLRMIRQNKHNWQHRFPPKANPVRLGIFAAGLLSKVVGKDLATPLETEKAAGQPYRMVERILKMPSATAKAALGYVSCDQLQLVGRQRGDAQRQDRVAEKRFDVFMQYLRMRHPDRQDWDPTYLETIQRDFECFERMSKDKKVPSFEKDENYVSFGMYKMPQYLRDYPKPQPEAASAAKAKTGFFHKLGSVIAKGADTVLHSKSLRQKKRQKQAQRAMHETGDKLRAKYGLAARGDRTESGKDKPNDGRPSNHRM